MPSFPTETEGATPFITRDRAPQARLAAGDETGRGGAFEPACFRDLAGATPRSVFGPPELDLGRAFFEKRAPRGSHS